MVKTAQSETGTLRTVLVRHARDAFGSAEKIATEWKELNYHAAPDFDRAVDEFDRFVELLQSEGANVISAPGQVGATLDSIYARDAAIITDNGAVLCAMGKPQRSNEPQYLQPIFKAEGIGLLGSISGRGRLEGGDVTWLPGNRLAVGRGYRSNDEGFRQLRKLTQDVVEEIVQVSLPHWRGPDDVFHLMSILSPVGDNAVLVYAPLLPVAFRLWLLERELRLIEVPDEEFESMASNVLSVAPGKCIALEGNPVTRARLEKAGIEVLVYDGTEISRKGEGGPTCLTRPLVWE
jgi:N-dimethylarginine dimethylaminohydrolase